MRIRPTHADVLLVIEVADFSLTQDVGGKADLYAEYGIAEYWVVDISGAQVHVFRNPNLGRYPSITQHDRPHSILPLCQPNASLALAPLFDWNS